jgi:hypothetical protein
MIKPIKQTGLPEKSVRGRQDLPISACEKAAAAGGVLWRRSVVLGRSRWRIGKRSDSKRSSNLSQLCGKSRTRSIPTASNSAAERSRVTKDFCVPGVAVERAELRLARARPPRPHHGSDLEGRCVPVPIIRRTVGTKHRNDTTRAIPQESWRRRIGPGQDSRPAFHRVPPPQSHWESHHPHYLLRSDRAIAPGLGLIKGRADFVSARAVLATAREPVKLRL